MTCLLCSSPGKAYSSDSQRQYEHCSVCDLVYVPTQFHLTHEQEKARYDVHVNDPNDPRYRKFLAQLMDPMLELIPSGSHGLDFGSGPGPTLSKMFEEKGFEMNIYDIYYAPDHSVLDQQYQFISMTEVVEHLAQPLVVLKKLSAMLLDKGVFGLMTDFRPSDELFLKWYYKNDPTHLCFFSRKSFEWIAKQLEMKVEFIGERVILLRN